MCLTVSRVSLYETCALYQCVISIVCVCVSVSFLKFCAWLGTKTGSEMFSFAEKVSNCLSSVALNVVCVC